MRNLACLIWLATTALLVAEVADRDRSSSGPGPASVTSRPEHNGASRPAQEAVPLSLRAVYGSELAVSMRGKCNYKESITRPAFRRAPADEMQTATPRYGIGEDVSRHVTPVVVRVPVSEGLAPDQSGIGFFVYMAEHRYRTPQSEWAELRSHDGMRIASEGPLAEAILGAPSVTERLNALVASQLTFWRIMALSEGATAGTHAVFRLEEAVVWDGAEEAEVDRCVEAIISLEGTGLARLRYLIDTEVPSPKLQACACKVLSRLGDVMSIPQMLDLCEQWGTGDDAAAPAMTAEVSRSMQALPAIKAAPILVAETKVGSASRRQLAADILREMFEEGPERPVAWAEWWEENAERFSEVGPERKEGGP